MRSFLVLLCVLPYLFLFSCDGSRQRAERYDKGYESAWEGEEAPSSIWTSKEEKEGHEAGLQDAWIYDAGYYDGHEGKRPEYFNDQLYMDAYKEGKKDKGRGR